MLISRSSSRLLCGYMQGFTPFQPLNNKMLLRVCVRRGRNLERDGGREAEMEQRGKVSEGGKWEGEEDRGKRSCG